LDDAADETKQEETFVDATKTDLADLMANMKKLQAK